MSTNMNQIDTFSTIVGNCVRRIKGYYGGHNKVPKHISEIMNDLPYIAKKLDQLRNQQPQLSYVVNPFQYHINQLNNLTTLPTHAPTYEKELFATLQEIECYKHTFSVYFEHASPRSVPRKPVNKHYHFPETQVGHYVNREGVFRKINETLTNRNSSTAPVVALIGTSGSGKTQLALSYCRQSKESGFFSSIFWIDASSPIAIDLGFSQIAALIDPSVNLKDFPTCIETVKYGLQTFTDHWLMVFDNFDERQTFEEKIIEDYFPNGRNGSILFTSRERDISHLGVTCFVDTISEVEAVDLFLHRSKLAKTKENIRLVHEICYTLEYFPSSIDLAAVYISLQLVPPNNFLKQFNIKKNIIRDYPGVSIYGTDIKEMNTDNPLNVFTLWEMIFEHVDCENKLDLKKFLSVCCFLNNRYLLEELFSKKPEKEWLEMFTISGVWSSTKYQEILTKLSTLSLILDFEVAPAGTRFSIHPLIQDWLRMKLKNTSEDAKLLSEARIIISEYIDSQDLNSLSWKSKEMLLSQVTKCLQKFGESNELVPLRPLNSFANVYYEFDMFDDAEKLYNCVLKDKNEVFCDDKKSALETVHKLSCVYTNLGQLEKAESLSNEALDGCSKLLGNDNPLTLEVLGDLGSVYQLQGKLDKAEEFYSRSLKGCQKVLQSDDKLTYEVVAKLADLYEAQGRLESAEAMADRLLQNREKIIGIDKGYILNTVNSLALAYKQRQKLDKAESLYKKALLGFEQLYKQDNMDTLTTVYNLAVVYHDRQKLSDAEKMYTRALNGFEKILASRKDAPVIVDYLDTMNNLAVIFYTEKALDKVESIYSRSLKFLEQILGPTHRYTLSTTYYLASAYHAQSKLNLAEPLYKRVLEGTAESTANILLNTTFNLGLIYEDQRRLSDAEAMFTRAKNEAEKTLAPNNEFLKDTVQHLTGLHKKHKSGKMKRQLFSVFAK